MKLRGKEIEGFVRQAKSPKTVATFYILFEIPSIE